MFCDRNNCVTGNGCADRTLPRRWIKSQRALLRFWIRPVVILRSPKAQRKKTDIVEFRFVVRLLETLERNFRI